MGSDRLTIVFFPEGAFGPTNNCVGIGNVLRARGHRVVFIVEESFTGTLEAKGFEEAHMGLQPPSDVEEEPGQFWKDFIRDTSPEFRKPTIEQLQGFLAPTWQALIDGATYVNPRLMEIFDQVRPDVVVEDNVVSFPALPPRDFMHESPFLNLYVYPEEADYARAARPAATWHRLDSSVRDSDDAFEVPEGLGSDGRLLYLSLGSLGSADVELMRRLIDVLGATGHRVNREHGPSARAADARRQYGRARSSCLRRRFCPRSTSSSPTEGTTRSPSASASGGR